MSKSLLVAAAAATAIALAGGVGPASAFIAGQSPVIAASQELGNTIEAKWKWKKWKKIPPGWAKGRKVGWRGGSRPPGQR